jgi:hypothetical protein
MIKNHDAPDLSGAFVFALPKYWAEFERQERVSQILHKSSLATLALHRSMAKVRGESIFPPFPGACHDRLQENPDCQPWRDRHPRDAGRQ